MRRWLRLTDLSLSALVAHVIANWVQCLVTAVLAFGASALAVAHHYLIGLVGVIMFVVGAWVCGRWTQRVEFYQDRTASPSVADDIAAAKRVWVTWHTATKVGSSGELGLANAGRHIEKLILLSPRPDGYLHHHGKLFSKITPNNIKSDIERAISRLEQEGVREVKVFDGPLLPMIIFNPCDKGGWIRVEPWGPFMEAAGRPIFIVRRNKHPRLFNRLCESYLKIWNASTAPKHTNRTPHN